VVGHAFIRPGQGAAGCLFDDGLLGILAGVGLEVHERPDLCRTLDMGVAGDLIMLEPGCYRRGLRRSASTTGCWSATVAPNC
jgi:hypothetical protein